MMAVIRPFSQARTAVKWTLEVLDMTGSFIVLMIILATVALYAIVGTVVLVVRDGRGNLPAEKSDRPWTAGNLPSLPYSLVRF
jgi:hypothetical protein